MNSPALLCSRRDRHLTSARVLQKLIISAFFFVLGAAPLKADLNASYSVGDMFFATYELPGGTPAGVVRLATIEEYLALGADAPVFHSEINVTDRADTIGELFLSTGTIVSDPTFDMLFVRSDTGEAVDWYRIEAANGGVRIQDMTHFEPITARGAASPRRISPEYNDVNREVAALLAEVSRQLSVVNTTPVDGEVTPDAPSPEVAPAPSAASSAPTEASSEPHPSDASGVYLPEVQSLAVVSEVHLATANLKNFILTILVAGLALLLAIALVLYKTRAMVAASCNQQQKAQPAPSAQPDQASASLTFLNYIKEENRRNQETYLKSIELLAANKQGADVSDQVKPQNASQRAPEREAAREEQLQVRTTPTNPQRPPRRIVQAGAPAAAAAEGPQKVSNETTPNAATGKISAQVKEKLDLADVYKNMGDIFVASNLLQEVIKTGNADEVASARAALKKIGET